MQAYVSKKSLPKYCLSIHFVFIGKETSHTIIFDNFLEQLALSVLVDMGNHDLC